MLLLENGSLLVQTVNELPLLVNTKEIFMDFETNWNDGTHKRKGDDNKKIEDSMPFHGDRICGVAITANDDPRSWYVPIRHRDPKWNLPLENVQRWLKNIVTTCDDWINHNINFDAHFIKREGIDFNCRLVDTLTLAKLIDSDRYSHALKQICRDWCGLEMLEEKRIKAHLKGSKSYDFSIIPADILGAYAAEDVTSTRMLYRLLQSKKTEDLNRVWETEIKFTPVLYDIEEFGMPVNEQELKIELAKSIYKSITLETELSKLIGGEINPNSNPQIYDLLVNRFGLPILGTTDTGGASFDKDVMLMYKVHPEVLMNPDLKRIIDLLAECITETHFRGLYLESFSRLAVNGILHPSYNQCVRTGRLSCKMPNAQQLNARAKALIHPLPGYGINSRDYSQIEFRLIVHYIKDEAAIQAYAENPKTDFHQWVADMGGIKRKIAKNVNFAIAFGAGKNKTVSQLKGTQDIIDEMMAKADEWEKNPKSFDIEFKDKTSVFKHFCSERAEKIYNEYHERLPGIKTTSYRASDTIAKRGFVYNAYGRRRHLPSNLRYRAFNAIIQSCASDVMKDRMIAIAPRYNSWIKSLNTNFFALVHDEAADQAPKEICEDPEIQKKITHMFEETSIPFRVPMVMEHNFSLNSWADAGK